MKLLSLGLGALGCLAAITGVAHAAEPSRPNVLFILADDFGWANTKLYGDTKFHRTPNLQRLAQRGMLFTRGYSASPLSSLTPKPPWRR